MKVLFNSIKQDVLSSMTGKAPSYLKGKEKERRERRRDSEQVAKKTGFMGCARMLFAIFAIIIGMSIILASLG